MSAVLSPSGARQRALLEKRAISLSGKKRHRFSHNLVLAAQSFIEDQRLQRVHDFANSY